MAGTTSTGTSVEELLAELAGLEDPRAREVNERHGDDPGVNLAKLRAISKRLKTQHELALGLWSTGDTAARSLALLVCRPKALGRAELDEMLRESRAPKVQDWLVNYVVKKSPYAEELRVAWLVDPDPVVASAGWALTSEHVVKAPEGLDLNGLLEVIEAEMKHAPERLQWAMNSCLAQIGIGHAGLRSRALEIGERLQVLKDYPTPPGCTFPFALFGSTRWCAGRTARTPSPSVPPGKRWGSSHASDGTAGRSRTGPAAPPHGQHRRWQGQWPEAP